MLCRPNRDGLFLRDASSHQYCTVQLYCTGQACVHINMSACLLYPFYISIMKVFLLVRVTGTGTCTCTVLYRYPGTFCECCGRT